MGWFVLLEAHLLVFDDGDGAGCQFALGVTFADREVGADAQAAVVHIPGVEGDAFVNATGGVKAEGK